MSSLLKKRSVYYVKLRKKVICQGMNRFTKLLTLPISIPQHLQLHQILQT